MWYVVSGMEASLGILLPFIFEHLPHVLPSCGFYDFLTNLVLLISVFVLFLRVAKWYKLQQKEIVVNVRGIWTKETSMRDSGKVMGIAVMLRKTDTLDNDQNCKGVQRHIIKEAALNILLHINKLICQV